MTREEAIERIKIHPSKKFIQQAITHQDRVRFFTTTALDKEKLSGYSTTFFDTINSRFNQAESYSLFINHMNYPLQTTEYVKGLYSDLSKIFEASNPFIDFSFTDKDLKDKNILDQNIDWFKTKAYESFMKSHNSIVIIDSDQNDEFKYYIIDISTVKAIEVLDNEIQWIIFSLDNKKYFAFDSDTLLVLETDEKGSIDDLVEIASVDNTLGMAPAVFLIDKNLQDDNEIIKQSLISDSLGSIEEILVDAVKNDIISDKIVPVIKRFRGDCSYDNGISFCVDGFLKTRVKDPTGELQDREVSARDSKGRAVNCPQCSSAIVPGATISEPYPETSEEKDILNDALQYVTIDKEIFEVADERLRLKKLETKGNILGVERDLNTKLNHNATEILANTESREAVLKNWKTSYERLIKSVMDKFLTLKHGDNYLGSIVNLGTSFFLTTFDDVLEEKKKADEAGLNTLDYEEMLISIKHKNDPEKRKRAQTVKALSEDLRPLNRVSREEVEKQYVASKISEKVYLINTNFFDWVNKYERELGDDISLIDIKVLAKNFKQKLNEYYNEIKNDDTIETE